MQPKILLRSLFDAAVAAADPMVTIPQALPAKPSGRVIVIGAGKASARMAEAVETVWGPCDGLVLTRYGYGRPTQGIEIIEASHPVPDQAGVDATQKLLDLLSGVGADDYILALISGGGSALLSAPAGDITLDEKQKLTKALLESGAPIGDINGIRKELSAVKGGRLAAAAYPAQMLALMISDVPGDDPSDIASGPTVGYAGNAAQAVATLAKWGVTPPDSVAAYLAKGGAPLSPDDPKLAHVENRVISAPSQSLAAAQSIAQQAGVDTRILGDAIEGEARDEAALQIAMAQDIQSTLAAGDAPVLLLSGGECTVTGWGGGVGGPNAEFCLAAAIALNGQPGIHVLACDTDGVDGAAEVAGAIVSPDTLSRSQTDAADALARSDSHTFFGDLGDQIVPGPTLTNVNDFRAILIQPLS